MKIQIITLFFGMLLFTGIVVPAVNANEFLETLGNVYMAEAAIAAGVGVVAPVTAPVALPVAAIVGGIGGLTFLIGTVCNPLPFHLCPLNPAIFTGWVQFSTNFSPTVFTGDLTPLLNDPQLLLLLNLIANIASCQAAANTENDACFNTSFNAELDCGSERFGCNQSCGAVPVCLENCESIGQAALPACFIQGENCFFSCSEDRPCERSCIRAEDACVQPILQNAIGTCNLGCGPNTVCQLTCESNHTTCQDTQIAEREGCFDAVDTELAACVTRARNGSDLGQAYVDLLPRLQEQLHNVETWVAFAHAMRLANDANDINRVNELALGLDAARNALVAHAPTVDASAEAFGDALMMVRLDEGVVVDDAFVVRQLDEIQFQGLPISVEDALRNIFGWTQEAIDNGITAQMLQGLQALTPAEIAAQQDLGKEWSVQTPQWLIGINQMTDLTLNTLPGVCQDASQCPSDDCNAGVCTAGQCSTEPINEGLACSGPQNFICISGVCSDGSLPTDETKLLDKNTVCSEKSDGSGFDVTVSGEASDLQGIKKIEVIFSFSDPVPSVTRLIFLDLVPPFDVVHPFSETFDLSELPDANIMIRITDGDDNVVTIDPPLVCLPPPGDGNVKAGVLVTGTCGVTAEPEKTDQADQINRIPGPEVRTTLANTGNVAASFFVTASTCLDDNDAQHICTVRIASEAGVAFGDKQLLDTGIRTQIAEVVPGESEILRWKQLRLEADATFVALNPDQNFREVNFYEAECTRDPETGNPEQVCQEFSSPINGNCICDLTDEPPVDRVCPATNG